MRRKAAWNKARFHKSTRGSDELVDTRKAPNPEAQVRMYEPLDEAI